MIKIILQRHGRYIASNTGFNQSLIIIRRPRQYYYYLWQPDCGTICFFMVSPVVPVIILIVIQIADHSFVMCRHIDIVIIASLRLI